MKKDVKKLNKRRCVITLIVVIIAIIIIISITGKKDKYENLTILLNNEFIELSNEPIIDENENIYFSKTDIQNIFDDTIYYNEAEKELITTYNTHIALLKVDEKYALINDENIELEGTLQEKDKNIYVPIKDIQEVYDIEISYSPKTNRIIIDSTLNKKIEASIIKRTKLKARKGLFATKTENLIVGDKVTILEEDGNYKKVKTLNGNIGYIKTKKLSPETTIREATVYTNQEIKVYSNYSNISGVYENLTVDEKYINCVIPTFFYVEKDSKVLDKTTSTTATYAVYKAWADNNKLTILPTFSNDEEVSNCLLSYSQRSQVINELISYLKQYQYFGININFNSINDINSFYRFIIELSPRLKSQNLKLAVTLNKNIDKKRIEKIVDYIIEE